MLLMPAFQTTRRVMGHMVRIAPDSPSDMSSVQAAGQVPSWQTHCQVKKVYL